MDPSRGYNRTARKLLHIAGSAGALLLPFIPYWVVLAAVLVMTVLALVLKPSHNRLLRALSKPADRIRGVITGLRGYCFAVLLLMLVWPLSTYVIPDMERYVMLGWLALAWGDGLAGLIGPSPAEAATVPWNRYKTWWGYLACLVGILAAYLVAFAVPWPGLVAGDWHCGLVCGGITALIISFLESCNLRVDDNYIVGLGTPLLALGLGGWLS
ncbi:hypothetical protein JW859_01040 [bacterium]|nr:hypothetical protein [bacterium]